MIGMSITQARTFHFKDGDNMQLQILMTFLKGFWFNLHTILFLAGLITIAIAGFMFNTIVGLVVTGIFLIVIAFILDKQGGER